MRVASLVVDEEAAEAELEPELALDEEGDALDWVALAALEGMAEDAAKAVGVAPTVLDVTSPEVEVASPGVLETSVSTPVAVTAASEASASQDEAVLCCECEGKKRKSSQYRN